MTSDGKYLIVARQTTLTLYELDIPNGGSGPQPFIPGYDLFLLLGLAIVVSMFLIRKRYKFKFRFAKV